MRNISRLINKWFPDIDGRIWVDLWSGVALVRFGMGLPIDAAALGVVLGAYVIHKATQETDGKDA